MNNFPKVSSVFKTHLFADDTNCVYYIIKGQFLALKEEVKKIPHCMQINGLMSHVAKTQKLQIGVPQEQIIFLDQIQNEKKSCPTYFAVKIYANSAFTDHTHEIVEKISSKDLLDIQRVRNMDITFFLHVILSFT